MSRGKGNLTFPPQDRCENKTQETVTEGQGGCLWGALGTDLGWEGKCSGRLRGRVEVLPILRPFAPSPDTRGRAHRTLVGVVSQQPVVLGGLPRPLALGLPCGAH